MNNSGKQQSFSDREVDDQQQSDDDTSPASSRTGEVSPEAVSGDSSRRNGNDTGLAARLTDLLVGDGDRDNDLLMQRNTQEGTVVQWLQALDMQVMGACRADERLKPLLKLNVSSVAEDRLLSHLSQHFEPSEVGLLARCLCIPLVSIRVGKINKQGTRLIPTCSRGNLVVSLLPTSDLRISYLGDDGHTDRLSILRTTSDCSSVVIEAMSADTSGRSFALRVPTTSNPSYFWCCEKSKLLGIELLEKMRNLLETKPSLADLTGISNSRLQRFVQHLIRSMTFILNHDSGQPTQTQSPTLAAKSSRVRTCSSIIQGSLSPRPSSFKEGMPRNLSSLRNVVRDKLRRRAEGSEKHPHLPSTSIHHEKTKFPSLSANIPIPSLSLISSAPSPPYYCWCPPVVSSLQYTSSESFTLPPFSLPSTPSSTKIPMSPFLPLSMPLTQFTPPIVHIPVIDICSSSGQAYLVSSVSIPPAALVQESDSEKSARDTLRLLLSGSTEFPSVTDSSGSRSRVGFYGGSTSDVNVIANSLAAMTLVSPGVIRRCIHQQGAAAAAAADLVDLPIDTEDGLSEGSTSTD